MNRIRPIWIVFGWLVAVAVAALAIFALSVLNLLSDTSAPDDSTWLIAALAVSFLVGGFATGARVGTAPVLHGIGIGFFSLVVWFAANLLSSSMAGLANWAALPLGTTVSLLFVQAAAAVVGARMGMRWFLRKRPAG